MGSYLKFGCPYGKVFEHNVHFNPQITIKCESDGHFSGPNKKTWSDWPLWPNCVLGRLAEFGFTEKQN